MLYVAIGHVCQDVVPEGKVLGGTVTFSALTARALGWSVAALTRAAPQLDLSLLGDIDCVRLSDEVTTTFENISTPAGRVQRLHHRAGPIRSTDFPPHLREADIVHLAPIAGEVEAGLADAAINAFVGVTPQGWMRQWDASGAVSRRAWPGARDVLRRAHAVVFSIDDVGGDWALIERWSHEAAVMAVTQGREGCTVFERGNSTRVPVQPETETDSVGAGDIFATTFFVRLRETGDTVRAAQMANCLARRSVTRRGLASIPTQRDAHECLAAA